MRQLRGEAKIAGAKLIGVAMTIDDDELVRAGKSQGMVRSLNIDGDFFLDGADELTQQKLLQELEQTLTQHYQQTVKASVEAGDAAALAIGAASAESAQGAEQSLAAALQQVMDRYPSVHLVGASASSLALAYERAIGQVQSTAATQAALAALASPAAAPSPAVALDEHDPVIAQAIERLASLQPVVVHDEPRSPQEQMRIDELWAQQVAAGDRPATLRIWEWASSAVVIGRFQSLPDEVDEREAAAEGVSVVRRCTGGGAMFIEPGNTITYSLYLPGWVLAHVPIEQSYQLADRWLVTALRSIGLDVRFAGLNDIASQHGKIGGAAQKRFPAPQGALDPQGKPTGGALLHHVTMAYDIDAQKMMRILRISREKMSDKAVKSAVKRVDPMRSQTGLSREAIIEHLIEAARHWRATILGAQR